MSDRGEGEKEGTTKNTKYTKECGEIDGRIARNGEGWNAEMAEFGSTSCRGLHPDPPNPPLARGGKEYMA